MADGVSGIRFADSRFYVYWVIGCNVETLAWLCASTEAVTQKENMGAIDTGQGFL